MPSLSTVSVLTLALALSLLAMLATVALVLAIFGARARRQRRLKVRRDVVALWRPVMLRALSDDLSAAELRTLKTLARAELAPFMSLWTHYHESVRGQSAVSLNRLAEAVDLPQRARDLLERGSPEDRLIALSALAHLGQLRDWARVSEHLDDANAYIAMAAAEAALAIDALNALPLVLGTYAKRTDWAIPAIAAALMRVDQEQVAAAIGTLIIRSPVSIQLRLMPLLRVTGSPTTQRLFHLLLQTSEDVALLSALLAQVSNPDSKRRVLELTQHADARVRAYAARALGQLAERLTAPEPDDDGVALRAWPLGVDLRDPLSACRPPPVNEPLSCAPSAPPLTRVRHPVSDGVSALAPAPSAPRHRALQLPVRRDARLDLQRLLELLGDPVWDVRYQAAQALTTIPGVTRRHLAEWAAWQDATGTLLLDEAWADLTFAAGDVRPVNDLRTVPKEFADA